jgi:hypothetical protein
VTPEVEYGESENRRRPKNRLTNMEWDEISFVDRGDNPLARVVLAKHEEPEELLSDAEIEAIIDEVEAGEPVPTPASLDEEIEDMFDKVVKGDMRLNTEVIKTRADAAEAMEALVHVYRAKNPHFDALDAHRAALDSEAGRQLKALHNALPPDPPQVEDYSKHEEEQTPGQRALAQLEAETDKLILEYGIDPVVAYRKVYDTHPRLVERIREEDAARRW